MMPAYLPPLGVGGYVVVIVVKFVCIVTLRVPIRLLTNDPPIMLAHTVPLNLLHVTCRPRPGRPRPPRVSLPTLALPIPILLTLAFVRFLTGIAPPRHDHALADRQSLRRHHPVPQNAPTEVSLVMPAFDLGLR